MGAADRGRPGRGQAEIADLALGHQVGQGADGVLDRDAGVNAVLVVQVDAVRAQPPEGAFGSDTDVRRAAVEHPGAAAPVRDAAEFGGQDDLVAAAPDGPADEFLVGERPVALGGIDKGDPELQRPVDGADGLGVIGARAGIGGRHPHGAQTDAGDIQSPQLDMPHSDCSMRLSLPGPRTAGKAVSFLAMALPGTRRNGRVRLAS